MSGGARDGAGRKPAPPELKKIPVGVKLPRWLVEWMREQPESQAVLIEDALKRRHKLKPPNGQIKAGGTKTIETNAARIANMIAKTDTDDRGILLSHVATLLRGKSQNYTATLIYKAAVDYGMPQNCPISKLKQGEGEWT